MPHKKIRNRADAIARDLAVTAFSLTPEERVAKLELLALVAARALRASAGRPDQEEFRESVDLIIHRAESAVQVVEQCETLKASFTRAR